MKCCILGWVDFLYEKSVACDQVKLAHIILYTFFCVPVCTERRLFSKMSTAYCKEQNFLKVGINSLNYLDCQTSKLFKNTTAKEI